MLEGTMGSAYTSCQEKDLDVPVATSTGTADHGAQEIERQTRQEAGLNKEQKWNAKISPSGAPFSEVPCSVLDTLPKDRESSS